MTMAKTQMATATDDLKKTANEQLQYERKGLKVFISAPFFSDKQIEKVKQVEKALEDNPTVANVYSPRLHQAGDGYPEFSRPWCEATYHHDLDNALDSDAIVEILDFDDSDTDSGTAYEMGYAKAFGKFITSIRFDSHAQNLMVGVSTSHHFENVAELRRYDFYRKDRKNYDGVMH